MSLPAVAGCIGLPCCNSLVSLWFAAAVILSCLVLARRALLILLLGQQGPGPASPNHVCTLHCKGL
jgi:hypothetical protein